MENGRKTKKLLLGMSGILVLVYGIVVYLTNRYVPFMMDDDWYATLLYDETPIRTLGDILRAQIWHYHNWGGRSVTHTILQLTLLAGEQFADVMNVMMLFLLAAVSCLVAENRRFLSFFAGLSMILGLNANWKMSMFWQAGAANYLYITGFILLFLYCYLREIRETEQAAEASFAKRLPGITFWIVPLGVIAGWSNENMGPAVWVCSLLVILLKVREKRRPALWMILGNVSCLAGSVLMIAAPGNFVRSAEVPSAGYGALWQLFLRCYAESEALLEYLFPTVLVLLAVLFVGKAVMGIAVGRRNLLLLLCALLSWGAMLLSPHYPDRATFGTMLLLICVILSMAGKIAEKRKELTGVLWTCSLLIWLRGMFFCGEFLAMCWGWIR